MVGGKPKALSKLIEVAKANYLDLMVGLVVIASIIAIGLAAAEASIGQKIAYDLGIAGLTSAFFYVLLVRIPDVRRRGRMKRTLLLHHRWMKEECTIQLLFASGEPSVGTELRAKVMTPAGFREHFYANDRTLWYAAQNELDYTEGYNFEAISAALLRFKTQVDFVLEQIDIDDEDVFNRMKLLSQTLGDTAASRRGTDEMKSFFGVLQQLLGGWAGLEVGTVDYDPVERLLARI